MPGKFGFGSMSLTWPKPVPIESAVETLKFITGHPKFGTKVINAGEFYGADDVNLKYLKEFVKSNTEEFNRELIISIKGGVNKKTFSPDGTRENIRKSVENSISYFPLDPTKRPKLVFEIARVDPNVSYDDSVSYIYEFVKEGKLDGISLSEVGVKSIQKAVSVAPISCVELEFSLATQDIFHNGVLEELSKHGIPIIAYSPLSRGLLTDYTVENADKYLSLIGAEDMRNHSDRFKPENFDQNCLLAKKLYGFAHDVKNCSLESLALSWILAISEKTDFHGIPVVCKILPIPSGSTKEKLEKNLGNLVELTREDLDQIDRICKEYPVKGFRYNEAHEALCFA